MRSNKFGEYGELLIRNVGYNYFSVIYGDFQYFREAYDEIRQGKASSSVSLGHSWPDFWKC